MKPRPSLTIIDNYNKTGEITNRSFAKSVYGGFHTTKNKDINLNMENTARRSVIEFPNYTQQTPVNS